MSLCSTSVIVFCFFFVQTQLHYICLAGNFRKGVVRLNRVAKWAAAWTRLKTTAQRRDPFARTTRLPDRTCRTDLIPFWSRPTRPVSGLWHWAGRSWWRGSLPFLPPCARSCDASPYAVEQNEEPTVLLCLRTRKKQPWRWVPYMSHADFFSLKHFGHF